MATLQTLERRVQALEARLNDVEGGFSQTIYRLERNVIKNDLRMARVLERLDVQDVTEDDVDEVLDQQ